jgi:glycosyltransferase involved in cell wall biosynthesis
VATRTPYLFHDHNLRPISARNWLNYRAVGLFASRAVVVSEACRRHLERAIPAAKLQVIRNGIDLGEASTEPSPALRRQLAGSEHAPLVALIGQPREEKGTHVLLEAAPEIVARHPDARILIVGYLFQDEYQRRLDELVRSHGLERHVIFTGWRNDVPAIVANVDVLAHCRVTPEPAALVLIEAMAAARPVVVSDTGGSGEIVIDGVTGRLYPPGDAKALARAVIELLDDPVRAAAMGRAGRTRVEQHFTLAAQARAFEQVYAELSTGAAA